MKPVTNVDFKNPCSCSFPSMPSVLHAKTSGSIPPCDLALECADLPGGKSLIGTDKPIIPSDGEGPVRNVQIAPLSVAVTTVTVAQFAKFVSQTGYLTDAEKSGGSYVFAGQVAEDANDQGGVFGTPWWRDVEGACWRNPSGGTAEISDTSDLPVVHISLNDARAFAQAVGGRLPTEAEWEYAARGGLGDVRYPWGDEEPDEGGGVQCRIWGRTGEKDFPHTTSIGGPEAAGSHAPNDYGLYNMCGNVWEWTEDVYHNGIGPDPGRRVLKGGSFLCHESYCFRYRIAARIGAPPNLTTSHQGVRIVFDQARYQEKYS